MTFIVSALFHYVNVTETDIFDSFISVWMEYIKSLILFLI